MMFAKIVFQACSFNHSDISPCRGISGLRVARFSTFVFRLRHAHRFRRPHTPYPPHSLKVTLIPQWKIERPDRAWSPGFERFAANLVFYFRLNGACPTVSREA